MPWVCSVFATPLAMLMFNEYINVAMNDMATNAPPTVRPKNALGQESKERRRTQQRESNNSLSFEVF